MSRLESGLEGKPESPPEPGLTNHEASDCSLGNQQTHFVLPQAVVDPPGIIGSDDTLQHGHQSIDAVVTDLLHETKDTSTEEDLGVAVLELITN